MKKAIAVSILFAFCATFVTPLTLAQSQKSSAYRAGRKAAAEDFTKKALEVPEGESQLGISMPPSPKDKALRMGLRYNIFGFILCNKTSQEIRVNIPNSRTIKLMSKSKEYRQDFIQGYKEKYRSLVLKECKKGAWVSILSIAVLLGILLLSQVGK